MITTTTKKPVYSTESLQERTITLSEARHRLREALGQHLTADQLDSLVGEVLAIKKTTHASCKHCGKRSEFEIPDARAVAASLSELLTQAIGRPGTESEDGQRVSYVHKVVYACECGRECDTCYEANGESQKTEEIRARYKKNGLHYGGWDES